jgi:hypothetical protein
MTMVVVMMVVVMMVVVMMVVVMMVVVMMVVVMMMVIAAVHVFDALLTILQSFATFSISFFTRALQLLEKLKNFPWAGKQMIKLVRFYLFFST